MYRHSYHSSSAAIVQPVEYTSNSRDWGTMLVVKIYETWLPMFNCNKYDDFYKRNFRVMAAIE